MTQIIINKEEDNVELGLLLKLKEGKKISEKLQEALKSFIEAMALHFDAIMMLKEREALLDISLLAEALHKASVNFRKSVF
jgi:hypothetical protein